jgi:hypothetical protein
MSIAEFVSQIRWRPQIGDPSFMGWLTVAAYGATAALCLRAAIRQTVAADTREARRLRRIWLGVAGLMLFLCVNKQFDLQSLVTDVGRALAARGGWYDQRRTVQRWFVFAAAAAGALTLAWMAWRIRFILRERIVLLLGLCSLLTFIVIRAASFHHVDVFLRSRIFGLRVNWILELGGIALIACDAVRSIRRPRAG